MEQDQEDSGLFNISLDSDPDLESTSTNNESKPKLPRDFQSEENFNEQLKSWEPKVETGELYKTLKLPINNPSKPESQKILHAIEELYFLRRYEEALTFAELALKGVLLGEFRSVLERYKVRCVVKKEKTGSEQAE